ncbi:MAG: molybdopterin molybdotransferase MoeA [Porticoccaceae bacterium]|jgi:molybdopterin molybdotransferase|nr:molybdopterin molybdotransferase MoeA [Porticoccaceae bacterium]
MMLTVAEAISRLSVQATPVCKVTAASVKHALGLVIAKDVEALIDVPPADNSAMDGYAFCFQDAVDNHFQLPVRQRIPAGSDPEKLPMNAAARIFTGAEIPAGADTVALQEQCTEHDGVVQLDATSVCGQHIRLRGHDIAAGAKLLAAGTCLRAPELGVLSSQGMSHTQVYEPLKVAIFSTGDEVVEPGDIIGPGQIYNSNRSMLIGLIESLGMQAVDLGTVADTPEATRNALVAGSKTADVVISAGGVSVGEEDHVRQVVAELGSVDFWRVAIKPGKPIAFGRIGNKPFIGLPGNPVSVFVTFLVLAKPFLLAAQGRSDALPLVMHAKASFKRSGESREVYLRGRLRNSIEGPSVDIHPNQSSGALSSVAWGNVLVRQKRGVDIQINDLIDVLVY